jgi:hypothetical protein
MAMRRKLAGGHGDAFRSTALSQGKARANVYGYAALKIGESEGCLPVAAVGGSDQGEEGVVLGDVHQRAIAESPTHGGEVACKHPYFTDKGRAHVFYS